MEISFSSFSSRWIRFRQFVGLSWIWRSETKEARERREMCVCGVCVANVCVCVCVSMCVNAINVVKIVCYLAYAHVFMHHPPTINSHTTARIRVRN
jgi:hypothetical protein